MISCVWQLKAAHASKTVLEHQNTRESVAMQIGTLINNVGLSYDHPDYLTTLDDTFIRQIIEINCLATTKVGDKAGQPGWPTSTWSESKSALACSVQLLCHGELAGWPSMCCALLNI